MKNSFAIMIITLFLGFLMIYSGPGVVAQPTLSDDCSNPTVEVTIKALVNLKFDTKLIEVPRATCVNITIINEDPGIPHDFSIDAVSGTDGIAKVYIPVNGDETASFAVMTPDKDITFEFYCSVPGHKAAGMFGDFKVGEGSSEDDSPGFGFWLSFTAFFALIVFIRRIRR